MINRPRTIAGSVMAGLLLASPMAKAATWLQCGDVVDVVSGQLLGPHTLLVEDGHIAGLLSGHPEVDADAKVHDLRGRTCLPGLMDMHVHLTMSFTPQAYAQRFTMSDAAITLRGADFARQTLQAGFTTVRNLGDPHLATVALRDAISQGHAEGPRIFTAGRSIATTGGHADPTNAWRADIAGDPAPIHGVVNGIDQARQGVRHRYKEGADLIKITATGGVLSVARSGDNAQFVDEELQAIIETAADYGMHVAAHAHGAEGMRRAVAAGVHSVEHGTYMDEEIIAMMVEKGTWYVPTIFAGKFVAEKAEIEGYFPAVVAAKAREIGPLIQDTFARAHQAGVRIAFGTDCGVGPHGENAREFGYMVEAGMSPADALRSATINAAELLGESDRLGQLREGFVADVIAVDGNPLEDVATLMDVRFVMRDGQVFRNDR